MPEPISVFPGRLRQLQWPESRLFFSNLIKASVESTMRDPGIPNS
jgi:hypothetical protein